MAHLFPITPQTLGFGFLIGCERAVTKVSGTFAPSADRTYCDQPRDEPAGAASAELLCVRMFDRDGWQTAVQRGVAAPAKVSLPAPGRVFAVIVPDAACA